jgi:transcriptional regulator with XRE-family HTH domain
MIKEYLFRNNLTVKEFAFQLKISTSYLYQLISGDRKPSLKLAQKIEECTQGAIDVKQLLGIDFGEKSYNIVD